jgi:hypothetical protein
MILTRRPYSASLLGLSPLHKCPKLEPSLFIYMSPFTRHWLPRLDFLLQCAVETKPCGCKEPAAQRTCFAAVADVRADCFRLVTLPQSCQKFWPQLPHTGV